MTALRTIWANQDKEKSMKQTLASPKLDAALDAAVRAEHLEQLRQKHARAMDTAAKRLDELKGAAGAYAASPTHQREIWLVESARHLTNARHAVGRAAKAIADAEEARS